jgi:hypothetical protein
MRPAAMGSTTMRAFSMMLSECRVGVASECECHKRCKQEAYGREFHHFVFLHPPGAFMAKLESRPASEQKDWSHPHAHRMRAGRLALPCPIVSSCNCKQVAEGSKSSPIETMGDTQQ